MIYIYILMVVCVQASMYIREKNKAIHTYVYEYIHIHTCTLYTYVYTHVYICRIAYMSFYTQKVARPCVYEVLYGDAMLLLGLRRGVSEPEVDLSRPLSPLS